MSGILVPLMDACTAESEAKVAFLLALRARGLRDVALLRAFETSPRRRFAPDRLADLAQNDIALPIGCGQVMVAPTVLADMIAALDVRPEHRVLEIGTGSGYSAAILSRIAAEVVTLERYRSLAVGARARLDAIGAPHVRVMHADGRDGCRWGAPFDRILVHAAFDAVPTALTAQLAPDGKLVGVLREAARTSLVRYARAGSAPMRVERLAPLALPPLAAGLAAAL